MPKLLVLPAEQNSLGGVTISLSHLVKAFDQCGASQQLRVLVWADSLMEQYLRQTEQAACMQLIPAQNSRQFMQSALQWVGEQPIEYPLLMECCDARQVLPVVALAAPSLRLSGRPIYHFFRDLARSYHPLGNLLRRLTFTCLSPSAICNSHFTAQHIQSSLVPKICGILYPPIDTQHFSDRSPAVIPPTELQPILDSGARVMLTLSRITEPGKVNDKNLRMLIPVLAQLKATGHHYHGVIVGQDSSPGQTLTCALLEQAKSLGVADCFTILPPTFAIKDYYDYADVVVTLAPREPFGRTVIEAIACGVPVVGSNTGGISEILHNFAPEWTVNPYDPIAAAATIVRVAADLQTPNILVQGRHWVETHCNMVDYARQMMAIVGLCPNLNKQLAFKS